MVLMPKIVDATAWKLKPDRQKSCKGWRFCEVKISTLWFGNLLEFVLVRSSSSLITDTQGSDELGFSEEVDDIIAPYNSYAYEPPSRSSRSGWQLRAGKRAGMWKLRTGKREYDEAGKRGELWKLRTGKRITNQFLKRDRMWKLRTGKRASMWKLRTGKRSDENNQLDDY